MKKFLLCFIVFSLALSCKKDHKPCGCSPLNIEAIFIVKNNQNADLLDPVTGTFDQSKIKIQYKDGNSFKDVAFVIRPPFVYGEAEIKFPFYQIISSQMANISMKAPATEFYINWGDGSTDKLSFNYNTSKESVDNVKLNGVLQGLEPSIPPYYRIGYLLK